MAFLSQGYYFNLEKNIEIYSEFIQEQVNLDKMKYQEEFSYSK